MTSSPLPWNLELKPDGFTYLKDFAGNQIAQFLHGYDADYFMQSFTFEGEVCSLEYDVEQLERKIESYKKTIESLETIISDINKVVASNKNL